MPPLFIPNPRFASQMQGDDDYRAGEKAIAEGIAREAETGARSVGAPWMPREGHETIEVVQDDEATYVVNTDYGGHLMEYGSAKNPPHGVLRNAARSVGAEVEES